MKTKHTPGPYTASHRITDLGGVIAYIKCLDDGTWSELAVLYHARFDDNIQRENGEIIANSHLFSAAPELLEALRAVLVWNDELEDKVARIRTGLDQRDVETLAHKIARALDKAEGKSCVRRCDGKEGVQPDGSKRSSQTMA